MDETHSAGAACPCGSETPLESCCGPILSGDKTPDTAEALLRARFTAFSRQETDFIVETNHPDQREADTKETVESWAAAPRMKPASSISWPITPKRARRANTPKWPNSGGGTADGSFSTAGRPG
jgi:hypothetical protein